jgi:hypothetical protein
MPLNAPETSATRPFSLATGIFLLVMMVLLTILRTIRYPVNFPHYV